MEHHLLGSEENLYWPANKHMKRGCTKAINRNFWATPIRLRRIKKRD